MASEGWEEIASGLDSWLEQVLEGVRAGTAGQTRS
jgi:hypothetical protein